MREQVGGEVDKEVLVMASKPFESAAEHDGCARVAEIQPTAARGKGLKLRLNVPSEVAPPSFGMKWVDQQRRFKEFFGHVKKVHVAELAGPLRVSTKH